MNNLCENCKKNGTCLASPKTPVSVCCLFKAKETVKADAKYLTVKI